MPTFDFICKDPKSPYYEEPLTLFMSNAEYEATKDSIKCPITKSPMERKWGGGRVSLRFKGTGFYCTDKAS